MGLFDFLSARASGIWGRADDTFPRARWSDLKGIDPKGWGKAYDDLIKASDGFSGLNFGRAGALGAYKKKDADLALGFVKDNLEHWSNPGELQPRDIASALENGMRKLVAALPELNLIHDNPGVDPKYQKSIEVFIDSSFTLLKLVAADLEQKERAKSDDSEAKWQKFEDTLALLKFKETVDSVKKSTRELPKELRMNGKDTPSAYFEYMEKGVEGALLSPVKLAELKENLSELVPFATFFVGNDKKGQVELIEAARKGNELLQRLGSAIASGDEKDPRASAAAQEALLYIESLSDVLEVKREGPEKRGKMIGIIGTEEKDKFIKAGKESVKEAKEKKTERRWEERAKEKKKK